MADENPRVFTIKHAIAIKMHLDEVFTAVGSAGDGRFATFNPCHAEPEGFVFRGGNAKVQYEVQEELIYITVPTPGDEGKSSVPSRAIIDWSTETPSDFLALAIVGALAMTGHDVSVLEDNHEADLATALQQGEVDIEDTDLGVDLPPPRSSDRTKFCIACDARLPSSSARSTCWPNCL